MKKLKVLSFVLLAGCLSTGEAAESTTSTTEPASITTMSTPLEPDADVAVGLLLADVFTADYNPSHLEAIVGSGDERAAWVLADLLRFYQVGLHRDELVFAFTQLTGAEGEPGVVDFVWASNLLMMADVPAMDGYADIKKRLYAALDERWARLFDNDDAMDWRLVTWGGVGIDDRPFGNNGPCNCIPALDDPATTDAAGGDWFSDDRIVFGVVVGAEALALPKHQMEVHEMVNVTLGGRDLGIPYCTLCGSAQAYLTDGVTGQERVVLRTSGLLSRSNKVMYDVVTGSILDTFTGAARTGPLAEQGVVLEQVSVVASTWGGWKAAHPDTRILAQDGGIGRVYQDDPLGGRDNNGPIFPVGDTDDRLPIQEAVVGVIAPSGTPIAFPVTATRNALDEGNALEFEDVVVRLTDGLRVYDANGQELPTHQAFWFAWSQFHPETLVWGEK